MQNTPQECTEDCIRCHTNKEGPLGRGNGRTKQDAPKNLHKEPMRNAPTEDESERPQKGCGRTPGSADPPLGPIRPNFLMESPTAFSTTVLGCTTS